MQKTRLTTLTGASAAVGAGAVLGGVLIAGAAAIQAGSFVADPFLPWAIAGGVTVGAMAGLLAFAAGCGAYALALRTGRERFAAAMSTASAGLVAGGIVLAAALVTRHSMPGTLTVATVLSASGAALVFVRVASRRARHPGRS
jgi:hypothetical protein